MSHVLHSLPEAVATATAAKTPWGGDRNPGNEPRTTYAVSSPPLQILERHALSHTVGTRSPRARTTSSPPVPTPFAFVLCDARYTRNRQRAPRARIQTREVRARRRPSEILPSRALSQRFRPTRGKPPSRKSNLRRGVSGATHSPEHLSRTHACLASNLRVIVSHHLGPLQQAGPPDLASYPPRFRRRHTTRHPICWSIASTATTRESARFLTSFGITINRRSVFRGR